MSGLRLAGASSTPFWLDQPQRPPGRPAQGGDLRADLVVVGGGLTGLWAALLALQEQPGRDVLVLDGHRLAWAASGRNGGFCSASITHGISNGLERWPDEMALLTRLGLENLDGIERAIAQYGIDCGFRRSGELDVAVEPWQLEGLAEEHEAAGRLGLSSELLDAAQTRALVDSPTYLGARLERDSVAMVDPARLVWGLADAVEGLGGRIHESTRVLDVHDLGPEGILVRTPAGSVRARQVVLGTNVFPSPVRRYRPYLVPVWDHVLVTEPLPPDVVAGLRWDQRMGVGDSGNQFHYYRLTDDDRLLFGGYDALYYFGNDLTGRRARNEQTEQVLAEHLLTTFPSLDGVRVTHTWGGAIDTCTRFCAFWGLTHGGRVAAVQGYTGLGVGASRFGAQVCLDLLAGRQNERTSLEMVRRKPLPFPPEPFRWTGIQLTRRAIARADAADGRRGPWLRTLDRLGLGFDS
ncbi:NAD(P)/FAD-dependent oxidoreductase [Angustibacter sp. McL0619]|uniref:NAD(P)/FAD-dependent oxidoreductase n=1 Tax=Angustibacter sp. McL0619 TaxID=3415676 RepID=UPI003CFA3183